MNRQEIVKAVEHIKLVSSQGDDEEAHYEEDALRNKFISYLAERSDNIGELAKIILSTKDLDFSRWYA